MKKLITISSLFILIIALGCKNQSFGQQKEMTKKDRFPEGDLSILKGEIDGKPLLVMINNAYKNYSFKNDYPWYLHIEIELKNVNEFGLPTDEEMEVLNNFEDKIKSSINKVAGIHFIERRTCDGWRDLYFYLDNAESSNVILQEFTKKPAGSRPIRYRMEKDPNWNKVEKSLKN